MFDFITFDLFKRVLKKILSYSVKMLKNRRLFRYPGLLGLAFDLLNGVFNSIGHGSLLYFLGDFALVLINVNQSIIRDITMLKNSSGLLTVSFALLGIWGALWLIAFLNDLIYKFIRGVFIGESSPWFMLKGLSFGILTLINMLGVVIYQVVTTGAFYGDFGLIWPGLVMLLKNTGVIITSITHLINGIPGYHMSSPMTNATGNSSSGSLLTGINSGNNASAAQSHSAAQHANNSTGFKGNISFTQINGSK